MTRRVPALVATVLAVLAIVVFARSTPAAEPPVFSVIGTPWMPVAPPPSGLTGNWFCPGVPATGEDGVGGELVIANTREVPVTGRVQFLGDTGESVRQDIELAPFERRVIDIDAALTADYVSAVVELDGGGGIVEQRAIHPAGDAVAACANATSDEWYLADGYTVGSSSTLLVLTNPYDDAAIVDLGFATVEGSREPPAFQGFPVAPRSVEVIDLAAVGAKGEEVLASKIVATRGRLVVGRAQHAVDGRLGYTMSLAAPALRDQWWFAQGHKGEGVSERFSIYNPTDDDVEVDVLFLGVSELAEVEPIPVPARQVVTFEPASVATLQEGPHVTVFATLAEPSIVVERALTRTADGQPRTTVTLGATARAADGYVPTAWRMAIGPSEPTEDALVVFNVDNTPGTITVHAVGPSGAVAVPGLTDVPIGAASRISVDLTDPSVLDAQLVVTSTNRIFVERSLANGADGARGASWALPVI